MRSTERNIRVIHSYNVVFAAFLITAGRLADVYGHKRVLLSGISLFSLASLSCALAPSLFLLIVFRGLQALGGAALGSVGFAVVGLVFPKEHRVLPLAIWSAIAALAAILGPIIGGLTLLVSWRLMFLINLPICALAFLLTGLLPAWSSHRRKPRFDVAGMLLVALVLISIILLLIETWSAAALAILLVIALLSLAGLILAERTNPAPLVDGALFRVRSFAASSLGMLLFWLAYQGATLIFGLYLLGAEHLSAEQAAFFIIPVPLANVAVSLLVRENFPQWARAVAGIVCGASGFLGLSALGTAPLWMLVVPALLIGMAASLCFTSFHTCVLSDIAKQQFGQASGIFNTCRQLATTLGAALFLKSISWHLQAQLTQLGQYAQATMQVVPMTRAERIQASTRCDTLLASLMTNQGSQHLPSLHLLGIAAWDSWFSQQLQAALISAFSQTWLLCAALALLALPLALSLRPQRSTRRVAGEATPGRQGGLIHANTHA